MGWKIKLVVIVALAMLAVGGATLVYAVHARYQGNEYVVRVTAAFNAAALLNGEETYTQPDKAVICSYGGRRYVIVPDNYKAVVSLLRKDCAMPLLRRVKEDAPMTIRICDSGVLRLEPDPDSVDGALISFAEDGGKRFTMHVRGGNIWKQIIGYATDGPMRQPNLPL